MDKGYTGIVYSPAKVRGTWNIVILGFQGISKYLLFQEGLSYEGGYISQGEVNSFSVYFLIFKCKFPKIQFFFACGALISNIHIFRFKKDAGLRYWL